MQIFKKMEPRCCYCKKGACDGTRCCAPKKGIVSPADSAAGFSTTPSRGPTRPLARFQQASAGGLVLKLHISARRGGDYMMCSSAQIVGNAQPPLFRICAGRAPCGESNFWQSLDSGSIRE